MPRQHDQLVELTEAPLIGKTHTARLLDRRLQAAADRAWMLERLGLVPDEYVDRVAADLAKERDDG